MKTFSKLIGLCMIVCLFAACGTSANNNGEIAMAKNKRAAARKDAERRDAERRATASTASAGVKTAATNGNPQVRIVTNLGEVVVELFAQEAPISTENFLAYARDGFYDGTIFHRVIPNFMVQCGGFDKSMNEKANKRAAIKNEANNGLKNERGTLAMARTAVVDSATSQFFINVKDNEFLNHGTRDFGYAVFGKVISGMEIVELIAQVPTGNNGYHQDVPKKTIVIERVEII